MSYRIRYTPPNKRVKGWGRRLPGSHESRMAALQHMEDRGLSSVLYSIQEEEEA